MARYLDDMASANWALTLAEHDWSEDQMADPEAARLEALRRVAEGFRPAEPSEARLLDAPEAQATSIDAFLATMRAQLAELLEGDEPNFVAEVIDAVRMELEAHMERHGAKILAGWATPFEGNHCDTTFLVRLAPR